MPVGKRRAQLEDWFENFLLPSVEGSVLPVT